MSQKSRLNEGFVAWLPVISEIPAISRAPATAKLVNQGDAARLFARQTRYD